MQTSATLTSAAAPTAAPQLHPTPSVSPGVPQRNADFATLIEALEYAARGVAGFNFYNSRGVLTEVLSYRDLRDRAVSTAGRLVAAGLKPGDRIGLLAATGSDFQILFFAGLYAGIIPVPLPLPTAFGRREGYIDQLRGQLQSSGARMVFGPAEFLPIVTEAAQGLGLARIGIRADLESLPEQPGAILKPQVDALCYIQYSSGSTRFPTGVCISHRGFMANSSAMCRNGVQIRSGDRGMSWLPFFHDMGLVGFMLSPMTAQIAVDYIATEDFARRPMTWLKLMSDNGGTVSYAPSFGYELCARRVSAMAEGSLQLDLSKWRIAGIGGEMIKPKVMQQFADAFRPYGFSDKAFCASYGMAETVLAISFAEAGTGMTIDRISKDGMATHRAEPVSTDDDRARVFVSCGKIIPGHVVEIRDTEMRVLGERQVGRIFAKGPSIMLGYYNDADATDETLQDGWLDTGDLGYWVKDELVIVGRAKDMLIINGRNIWPQDIEWTVERMEGMRSGDSAAIVLTGADGSDQPTILVQCRPADPAERAKMIAAVRARVQEAVGVACDVVPVPPRSLPKTSSGKLARGRAKSLFERGELTAVAD